VSSLDTLPDLISVDQPLEALTTYKLGGPARWYAEPGDIDELSAVLTVWRTTEVPLVVLGRGSNVLVADAGFDGLVIRPIGRFAEIVVATSGTVTAGCAAPLPRLARAAVKEGRAGLEFFVGIPGSVGGAVRMNAGCHGSETKEWLVAARVIDVGTGELTERDPAGLDLSYRHSNLRDAEIVVAAHFRTVPGSAAAGERLMREIGRWRKEHQPGGTLNAGSVFKNPPGDSAGRIIDEAGLKGFAIGGAVISTRHANFIEAGPGASAGDVYELIRQTRERVAGACGVTLDPEVRFVGDFEESAHRRGAGH
jgi:UDP-N-acetylmuramate dehydrogenase